LKKVSASVVARRGFRACTAFLSPQLFLSPRCSHYRTVAAPDVPPVPAQDEKGLSPIQAFFSSPRPRIAMPPSNFFGGADIDFFIVTMSAAPGFLPRKDLSSHLRCSSPPQQGLLA